MCGIITKLNFDGSAVNEDIFDQYAAQRSRGYQGFGLYDGQAMHMVKATKEEKILKWLGKYKSNFIMFHHRFPTSTINVKRAAHPFSTRDYFGNVQYIMVHNGIIKNAEKLFGEHAKLDIDYDTLLTDLTFNDSEALLWDLALTLEGQQTAPHAIGDAAFVMLKTVDGKLDKMYFGRNAGRPLRLFRDKETIELSSEGRGEPILVDTMYTWNYNLKRLTSKQMRFQEYYGFSGYSGYRGYGGGRTNDHSYVPYTQAWDDDYEREWESEFGGRPGYRIPETTPTKTSEGKPILVVTADDILDDIEPSLAEVQAFVYDVLIEFNGVFEEAYWELEHMYEKAQDKKQTKKNAARTLLIEAAMSWLQADPEYVNETSISTMFGGSTWLALVA